MKTYTYHKWRIWTILTFSFVMALFHRSAIGAISQDLTLSLELTASELSALVSITFYTYALMQIPAGILLDLFGYKKISALGMLVTGLGSVLFSFSTHFIVACVSRFLIGMGTSVIFISILKMQHLWFTQSDFTKASGLLSFVGNMGGVIATFPLALLAILMGWRSAMFLMGGICICLGCIIFLRVKNTPRDYGFSLPNSTPLKENSHTVQDKAISVDKKESVSPIPQISVRTIFTNLMTLLRHRGVWRNFFVLFTITGCTTTLTGLWGINYLINVYGLSNAEASFYVAFMIYGFVCGSLAVNPIARLFKNNLIIYPRIACVGMLVCWTYILFVAKGTPPLEVLALLLFILGFLAMSHILAFTDVTTYCEPHTSGLASSLVNSGEFLGSSIISLLIGLILDFTWSGTLIDGVRVYEPSAYILAFSLFIIVPAIGLLTSFLEQKSKP